MARSIVVYVSGIDGSGKTTIATTLEQLLKKRGIPVVRIWFRFPYLLLYPLLFLARKLGLTKEYRADGKVFTVHFFERIPIVFEMLFVFDFTLHYIFRVLVRTIIPIVLIVERGPMDNLVDMLSDTGATHATANKTLIKYFINLQKRGITILADANLQTILQRRGEAEVDPKFKYRYYLYRLLTLTELKGNYIYISTVKRMEDNNTILYLIGSKITQLYGPRGYGKLFKHPYLKAFFSQPYVILMSNWLAQGIMIADIFENILRIASDIIIPLTIFAYTFNYTYALAAFLAIHTLNYLFNSNSTHVLRFFMRVNVNEKLEMTLRYITRQRLDGVIAITVFGSVVRGEQSSSSDIDIRVIRRDGVANAIKAYVLTVKLRLFALRKGIPLDIFMHTIDKLCKTVNSAELDKMIVIPNAEKAKILHACLKTRN